MTREEAINEIKGRIRLAEYVDSSYVDCVNIEALKVVIKELGEPNKGIGLINRYKAERK